jgi:ribosomal protein S18 acetylase RimI-like enzyme
MEPTAQSAFRRLLDLVSDEFVPSLNDRNGTTDSELAGAVGSNTRYLDDLLTQDNLLLVEDGVLIGFLSYRARHRVDVLPEIGECLYVTTIAIRADRRRGGHARRLYETLFSLPDALPPWVVLRTWSTNDTHLRLLASLGFELRRTLPNHRGQGLHTMYYGRPTTANRSANFGNSSSTCGRS